MSIGSMGVWGCGSMGVLAVCLLAGCGLPGAGAARERNTLRLAWRADPQSLDPAISYDTMSWPFVRLMFRSLLDYDDGVGLVPSLAEAMPTVSPDGRTYTFRLKQGVRFSTGRELIADDFVYSLERILDPKTRSPGDGFFRNILGARAFQKAREQQGEIAGNPGGRGADGATRVAGLRALDRYTLQIRLQDPDLAFRNIMAMPFAAAVPREEVERYGEDFFRHPVGVGPFVLKEWIRGVRLRFERNPLYYLEGEPRLDAVELAIGADPLTQQMMFERDELDLIQSIPAPDFVRLTASPRWKPYLHHILLNAIWYLSLNCEMPPFNDLRVRQAMNYAVDKARVLKVVNGRGVPARGVLPPDMPGHRPDIQGYPYDPAKAKQLLAAAGYPGGFSVPLLVGTDVSEWAKICEAVQQDLSEVGVRVQLRTVAGPVMNELVGQRQRVPLAFSGWFQDYPDPGDFLDVLFNGDRIVPVHCNNIAFYSNPEVNALLRSAATETDAGRRIRFYQDAERIIVRDAPWVFLYHPVDYRLRQPRVRNYTMHPVWPERLETLWFEKP
jgi:oligopeptide transport system substrate-binding protein